MPWEEEADDSQIIQRHCLNTMDMTQALRQITGQETIQFRRVQTAVLQAIQNSKSPVLAVMRIDRKKNILFILPVFTEPGETIIMVVPLLSLHRDIIQQCQILDISCISWESCRLPDKTIIILVTPESAVTEDFYIFINRLKQTQRLNRIVIDKYYVVLNNQQNFRSELQQLKQLNHARIQIVLLTATLSSILEKTLLQYIEYQVNQVRILQNRTSRSNMIYRVWYSPNRLI